MFALVWTLFIIVAVWFLLVRPQRKRMQEHQALMASLEVGHEIVTAGGIHGRIEELDSEALRLEIAPGTVIDLARRAVARNLTDERDAELGRESDVSDVGDTDEG